MQLPPFNPAKRRQEVWTAIERAMPQEGEKHMQTMLESWIEEGFVKGMNEGVDIGRAEGVNIGRAEGVQALFEAIVEILELRFSSIPQSLKDSLRGINDLSALKNLRQKLRGATSIDECERIVSQETPH